MRLPPATGQILGTANSHSMTPHGRRCRLFPPRQHRPCRRLRHVTALERPLEEIRSMNEPTIFQGNTCHRHIAKLSRRDGTNLIATALLTEISRVHRVVHSRRPALTTLFRLTRVQTIDSLTCRKATFNRTIGQYSIPAVTAAPITVRRHRNMVVDREVPGHAERLRPH